MYKAGKYADAEEARTTAYSEIGSAVDIVNEDSREIIENSDGYKSTVRIIDEIKE